MRRVDLRGRTAVITGAGSGIGMGIAQEAAAIGMNLVLADIAADRLAAVGEELRATGVQVLEVPTDVTDAAQVDALADAAYSEFGHVALLANNAGLESVGYTWDVPVDEWHRVVGVNLHGVFHGIRSFVPRMGADANPSQIVNTCSVAGIGTTPKMTAYAASKHGVQALTECLYLECADAFPHVSVAVFNPAEVVTRIWEDMPVAPDSAEEAEYWRVRIASSGITPREAGVVYFDGIEAGEFWITTHPESFARLANHRAQLLSEQLRPGGTVQR